jgi:capsular polysaccharide biosynthesis protein
MMQNNNPNINLQEDEIDLKEIFKILINSKKLIIVTTLIITLLGTIYSFQKAPLYKSTALIEIGQYNTFENENILLESASKLIQNLNIVFIHKSNEDINSLSIKTIENKLIQVEIRKPSKELSKKTLNEIIRYIENRHSGLEKRNNQSTQKILTRKIANKIVTINNQLPYLATKIVALKNIIIADEHNLKLLQSNPELLLKRAAQSPTLNEVIYSYNDELLDLKSAQENLIHERSNLESKLKLLESNSFDPKNLFKLNLLREKDDQSLELDFLVMQNPTRTQLIGEIITKKVATKKELIISLSFIMGLFLSIIMVFINNSLKALKE